MACNAVPIFFGAKARTKKPPGVDVTFITDLSGSMGPYAGFIASSTTITALETALVAEEIGVLSPNRYSFTSGSGSGSAFSTLSAIERNVTVAGVSQRWAPGANVLNGTATLPTLSATAGGDTEDMGKAANLVAGADRGYLQNNTRIIVAGSDEQSYGTAFVASPTYPYRYVGVHNVTFSISEPAGPNAIPAGTLVGFVYTTNTTGAAIYVSGSTINYRLEVPVANVTVTAASGNLQINVNRAAATNGAIYDIDISFAVLGESLGNVLGNYLFSIS
jgi:hypothetical protein